MYLSFAIFCEGPTDYSYLEVIIPKLISEIILQEGLRNIDVAEQPVLRLGRFGRAVDSVAQEACSASGAFHLMFVHADTGGRALEEGLENRSTAYCLAMNTQCNWPCERCIVAAPRHETEAWAMLDRNAISGALGYTGDLLALGLPRNAAQIERLVDPKSTLNGIISSVRGRRRSDSAYDLYPAIAARQEIIELRNARSFRTFETQVRDGLKSLGCIN